MSKYIKIDKKVEQIVKKVSLYIKYRDIGYIRDEIFRAYNYSIEAHEGQFRLSGDPYILHPVESTIILLELKPDIYTIQACLLHDVIEDTNKTYEDIKKDFGDEVAFLCSGMEKISKVKYKGEERNVSSLRKMFIAMAEDIRVIFIKLADRLHNMKTLKYHPQEEKRIRIAEETLTIYAPIADRLGLFSIKNALEEECFKILDPNSYKKIKEDLKDLKGSCEYFVTNSKKEIEEVLIGFITNYEIDYRIKSIYSIYKKMQKKSIEETSDLYDLFGLRVIVPTIEDCYKVLGLIHSKWKPIPNRFKDYIALPKPNGYKSLHTTVIGLLKSHRTQPTEIQIKTFEMKEYSDIGIAAHFDYKEKGSKISTDFDWVNELKELTDSLENKDIISSFKIDVFKDRIFVFTPKGASLNLPAGSTCIDFAYYVHTDLGNHINFAKVNGIIYPLDKELNNGDVVEIFTQTNKTPNPFWLSFVKTVKAKNRIKSFLKQGNTEDFREKGKELLNLYLKKSGLEELDKDFSILKFLEGKENNLEERKKILERIGDFSIKAQNVIRQIFEYKNKIFKNKNKLEDIKLDEKDLNHNIIIGGEEDLPYILCSCVTKKIPNKIVAHINSKGIITIHNRNCKILKLVNKDRLLSAYIKGDKDFIFFVNLELIVKNGVGILKTLSEITFSMGINIYEIKALPIDNKIGKMDLKLEINDFDYMIVDRLIDRLKLSLGDKLIKYIILNKT